ncbi:MAG: glycosyltransferase family 4 protein, partial [Deltaproteobacteria bacterium]|nr:glycosyltransferase family 4 protein [Deltaproteobacteria bacterium]
NSLGIFEKLHEQLAECKLVVLTSGVIDRRKNIEYLLEVFETLVHQPEPHAAMLLVAGDGPLLQKFKQFGAERSLSNVQFLGWCDSLDAVYPFVDLVVHPALHEGVPNSVLEALAANIPVLCADTPEMREVLRIPELFFDTKNSQSLTSRLQAILESPSDNLGRLTVASAKAAEHLRFDWDQQSCRLVEQSTER